MEYYGITVTYIMAFGAGLALFFSPCLLPVLPGFFAFIGGSAYQEHRSRWRIFRSTLFFVLGFTFIFCLMGLSVNFFGKPLTAYRSGLEKVGGLLLILFGLFAEVIFGFTAFNGESWGFYIPFVICALLAIGMIIHTMISTNKKPTFAALSGFFILLSVLISIFDNSWSFHFSTAEGVQNPMFRSFFDHILIPVLSTMFALLAFFIASAAYRAFRARNLLATLLLIAALIVMLRFNPWMAVIYGDYGAKLSNWLMNVPNLAAQRAIVIGIGLGIVATALKIILGIERGYMGKG